MVRRRPLRRPYQPKFSVPDDLDPREVRRELEMSQERFAAFLGLSVRTIQAWERVHWVRLGRHEVSKNGSMWKACRRVPTAAARVLLALVSCDPWIIHDTLRDDNG